MYVDLIHTQDIEGGETMNIMAIEAKRKEKRITVNEMCDYAGIDRTTYYKIKTDPGRMRVSTLRKIAELLELTDSDLQEIVQ